MIVGLLGLLVVGCGSATTTQTTAPPATTVSVPAVPTAASDAAKRFRTALENAGFKGAEVIDDYDDTKNCVKPDPKNKSRCQKWKDGAALVGYDSYYAVSDGCVVELETDLQGKAWKADSVNGNDVDWGGSPNKDSVLRSIRTHNNATPSLNDNLCNIA